jgi:hypothetical protein
MNGVKTGKQIRETKIRDLIDDDKKNFNIFLESFKNAVNISNEFIKENSGILIGKFKKVQGPDASLQIKHTIEQDGLNITYDTKTNQKGELIFEMKMGNQIIMQQVIQKTSDYHIAFVIDEKYPKPLFIQMTKLLTMVQTWVDIYIKTKHDSQTTIDVQSYRDKLNEYQNSLLQITYDLRLSYNFDFNYDSYYDKYIEKFEEYVNSAFPQKNYST